MNFAHRSFSLCFKLVSVLPFGSTWLISASSQGCSDTRIFHHPSQFVQRDLAPLDDNALRIQLWLPFNLLCAHWLAIWPHIVHKLSTFQFFVNDFYDCAMGQRTAFDFLKIAIDLVHSLASILFNQEANSIDCVGVNFTRSIFSFFVTHICSFIEKLPMPSTDHPGTNHITINFGYVPMDSDSFHLLPWNSVPPNVFLPWMKLWQIHVERDILIRLSTKVYINKGVLTLM